MQLGRTAEGIALADHRFPCPSCGSDLRFDPASGELLCAHCGTQAAVPEDRGPVAELDLRAATEDALDPGALEETRVVRCESCGAQVEFDADLHARECPFCASPIVTDTGLHRHIKPQAQLPFLLSEEEGRAAMRRWFGRLWFAPSDLKRLARAGRAMNGIYVPYWTYDAETRTEYRGQRGKVYHQSRRVAVMIDGKRRMTTRRAAKVRWSPVRGRVSREFDDVLVLGSTSLPKRFSDALAPWDLSALSAYEPRYLAGFRAEGYGIQVEDAYQEAREIMDGVIRDDIRRDIGGDRQRIDDLRTEVGGLTFKHVLLPVWMAAYRYRGRAYRFVVNGRTGAVSGERPYSPLKIALAVVLALIVAAALAVLQVQG